MVERDEISRQMRDHYESVWNSGDAWDLETSEYERLRLDRLAMTLSGRRYRRVLEIGCGSGALTRRLADIADLVVSLDIASAAIERARRQTVAVRPGAVRFEVADVMTFDLGAGGPWDLIVLSEAIYCIGWLYPFFDVAWLAMRFLETTQPGGRLLLANTYGQPDKDWLLLPCLINSYRELFRNVGYRIESEETFRGIKEGVDMEVLISLFCKDSSG